MNIFQLSQEQISRKLSCLMSTIRRLSLLAFVVFFGGDGQHRVEDLQKIIRSYETDPCDLIIGSRYKGVKDVAVTMRSLGTRTFSRLTTILAGVQITDVTNGLKLIS